jgi:hypothetical protein
MTDDQTQAPPFLATCLVVDGIVTELTGVANQYWLDEHAPPGTVGVAIDTPLGIGWAYDPDARTFTPPTPAPLEG